MNITEDLEFKQVLLKKIEEREFSERTGVHNSDLVYCLNRQALRRREPVENTERETLLYSIGWATQRWLTGRDTDEPEIIMDGITVTMDATFQLLPWELKATYQSSNKPVEDNVAWTRQIMSQCYVTHTTVARLSRLELMGDWKIKDGNRPTLHAFRLEFTLEELARHWAWMQGRRGLFQQVLDTGEPLPRAVSLPSGMDYLCNWCAYKDVQCK